MQGADGIGFCIREGWRDTTQDADKIGFCIHNAWRDRAQDAHPSTGLICSALLYSTLFYSTLLYSSEGAGVGNFPNQNEPKINVLTMILGTFVVTAGLIKRCTTLKLSRQWP